MTATSITDAHRTIALDALPDRQPEHSLRLTGTSPLIERFWRLALHDAEINIGHSMSVRFGSRISTGRSRFQGDAA